MECPTGKLTQIMEGRLEGVEFRIYRLRIAGDRDCTGGPRQEAYGNAKMFKRSLTG